MKHFKFLLLTVLLTLVGRTYGDNLTVANVELKPGESKNVAISLENPTKKYTAFQFDLELPEGVTVELKNNGKPKISLNEDRIDDHTLTVQDLGSGSYRLLCFSMSNAELYGTSGTLITMTLHAADNVSAGAKTGNIKSQVFTETSGTQAKWDDFSFTITIAAAVVPEVTADNKSREYGEENPTFTYTTSASLTGEPSLTTTATKASPVGEYDIVVERGTITGDYTAKNGKLTITKAPLTITAKSYTIKQGEALPTLEAEYSGFKNNETKAVLTTQPTITTSATSASEPGTYDIVVSGASATNYDITHVKGTLTITQADYDALIDGIYYKFNGDEAIVTQNPSEYQGDVVIPSSVNYNGKDYSVTSIGDYAFFNCFDLTSATIGNSVTSIGEKAFSGCSGLTSVTIGNSVTSIGGNAFTATALTSIIVDTSNPIYDSRDNCNAIIETSTNTLIAGCKNTIIPNSVTSIGESAFCICSGLSSITIPNSVTSIGESAFYSCSSLTSVTIGNSVTSIGGNAFRYCHRLTSVIISNSVTSIGHFAFQDCSRLTSVTIPNSVTSIGDSAFSSCYGLTSVTIGNSVTSIGESAFSGCSGLTSVTIPNSVTSIGESAFSFCSGLTSVTIGNSVTSIGGNAFRGCSGLTSIEIPNSVTSIGGNAFENCYRLTSVTIGNSVTSIGESAFSGCSGLTSVTIGNSVTSISDNAFRNCSGITSIVIPNSVTSIGKYAFWNCSGLTSIVIPNSVTSMGRDAFYRCSGLKKVIVNDIAAWCGIEFNGSGYNPLYYAKHLYSDENTEITNLVIPNSVTRISNYAFYHCSSLISVSIPNSVKSIGRSAFGGCSGLTSVKVYAKTPPDAGEYAFHVNDNIKLYVPQGSKAAYETADVWKDFNSIAELDEPFTLTANNLEMIYGDILPEFTYTSEGGTFGGMPQFTCEATSTSPVGTYPIVVSKGTIDNELGTYVNGTLTVTKAPLTITAKSYTIKQGDALPTFEADYAGFKNSETKEVLTTQPTITTSATSANEPGTYEIIVSGASATNYDISYVKGTLTISPVDVEPVTETETTTFSETVNENTNLSNTVIDNTYFNMNAANGDGYDATEQAIVLNSTTSESQMNTVENAELGDAAMRQNFNGIIFEVAAGSGTITIDVRTKGTYVLNVQIGKGEPTKINRSTRGTADVTYNVTAPTYIYLYASTASGNAAPRRAASANSVLLYGYKVTPGGTGIREISAENPVDVYNMQGNKVRSRATTLSDLPKGVYIVNGRKVIVK